VRYLHRGIRQSPELRIDAELGIVYGRRGRPIGSVTTDGYLRIDLRARGEGSISAHRLIWITANGPIPDGLEINHQNGIKLDNRISNLELVTRQGNVIHAWATGLNHAPLGEDHHAHRLTDEAVRQIRARYRRYSRTANARVLAAEFGVGRRTVAEVCEGNTWRHIDAAAA
jgi:hypothetical protein